MRLLIVLVLASFLAPLSGCGINSSSSAAGSSQAPGATTHVIGGHVHGGQNPVNGAVIQLWAVGTTGYGSPATPLITSTVVTTGPTGYFGISGDYSCAGNPLVYLTATGGNTGGSGNNDNLLLVAPLGYCNSLKTTTQIQIDEVTTVAAAYALGQFTNPATGSIGSYSYSTTGLANAFTTVNNLVDISMGTALASTPSGVGIPPQSEIDTLGNIMASCVNSVSSNAALSAGCSAYFAAATPPAGTAPTDTFDAMVDIAHNPGQQVSTLFNLAVPNPPFNPILSTAPHDWTIGIAYAAQGNGSVAVDSQGNVWHPGFGTLAGSTESSVYAVTPAGAVANTFAFTGLVLAIDTNDHGWMLGGDSGDTLYAMALTAPGGVPTISSYTGPFTMPFTPGIVPSLAIDGSNNLWFPERAGLTKVSTSGAVLGTYTGGGYSTGGAADLFDAVDSNGNIWVTIDSKATVSEFSNSGTVLSPSSGYSTTPGPGAAATAAFDAANDVWLANSGNAITELSSTGAQLSPSGGDPNGSGNVDSDIAVDGSGSVWVTTHGGIDSFNSSGAVTSPVAYSGGAVGPALYLAIDASGNLWFTGVEARGVNPIGLIEDVGIAAPVVTPMASAVSTHQLGIRPGTPIPVALTSAEIPPTYGSNIPYSAQLYVTGGNTGTYLWSIASGALPSGFTLNSSTGLISGSSTDPGNSAFTVQVCDAQNATNCASQAFTLINAFIRSLHTLGGENLLNGNYVLHLTGMQNAGSSPVAGSVHGTGLVGYLYLNHAGAVGSGDFYVTSPQGSFESSSVFGSYDLPPGGNGPGQIVFTDGNGNLYRFSIVVDKIVGGVAQEIRLTEFDDTQAATGQSGDAMASGIGKLQIGAPFAATYLEQSFAFGLEGETPCTNSNNTNPSCGQTVAPFGPLAAAGLLTGTSSTVLSGELDGSGLGTSYNNISFTGTWTPPGSGLFGFHGSLTLAYTGTLFPVPPSHFAYYPVSDSEFFFISTDSHTTTSLLSGDAIAQTGPLNTGTLNGVYLGVESVASGGDGISVYGSTVNSAVHFIDSNGAQAVLVADENNAGTLSQDTFQANTAYSIDGAGRTTFTQTGLPIYYLANGTQGFGVEQPTAGNPPGLITLTQQANITFGASSLNGGYGFTDLNVPAQDTTADGILTADSVNAGTITADEVSAGGLLSSPSQSLTYTMVSDGRGTLTLADGTSYILWLLSPTQWIALPTTTDPRPLILTGTQQ